MLACSVIPRGRRGRSDPLFGASREVGFSGSELRGRRTSGVGRCRYLWIAAAAEGRLAMTVWAGVYRGVYARSRGRRSNPLIGASRDWGFPGSRPWCIRCTFVPRVVVCGDDEHGNWPVLTRCAADQCGLGEMTARPAPLCGGAGLLVIVFSCRCPVRSTSAIAPCKCRRSAPSRWPCSASLRGRPGPRACRCRCPRRKRDASAPSP